MRGRESGRSAAAYRDIFLRAPPPSYDAAMKQQRRATSAGLEAGSPRRERRRRRTSACVLGQPDPAHGPPAYCSRRR